MGSQAVPFQTLSELLTVTRRDFAAREVFGVKHPGGRWRWMSYRDFGAAVDRLAAALHDLGVSHGDRIGLIANNRIEWATTAFACFRLGALIVPMYEQQRPSEWEFIAADAGVKGVFVAGRDGFDQVCEFQSRLVGLEFVVAYDAELGSEPPAGRFDFAGLQQLGVVRLQQGEGLEVLDPSPSDLAALLYTSGTTGRPKGVQLSHRNICSNVLGALERFDFQVGDRSLAFLPWAHAFGQVCELYCMMAAGGTVAINDAVPHLLDNLQVVRPTVLVAVPRIFNRIYDRVTSQIARNPRLVRALFEAALEASVRRNQGLSLGLVDRVVLLAAERAIFRQVRERFGGHLRFVVSGSAALSPAVAEFIDALGIDVFEGYGLTETSPVVTANDPKHRMIGTVGRPFPGVSVRIDRAATGDAQHGEIVVQGPNVTRGYYNRPEETAAAFTADGAFRTGDMGYVDARGFLHITGRIKEQYKLENGKYVVPAPLEEELKLSPFFSNAMLYGDNKPYNVVLLVLDLERVLAWAKEQGLTLASPVEEDSRVRSLVSEQIDRHCETFKQYERPRGFLAIVDDFTVENDMLTPKMSLRRRNILAHYESRLLELYSVGDAHRA